MKTPNVIALPTSQMEALCDVLGLGKAVQESTESMILALEAADFSKLKVVKSQPDVPRPENTIGYALAQVGASTIASRKAKLGRT